MNEKHKRVVKGIVYSILDRLDVLAPKLSAYLIRRFFRLHALNDLRIPTEYHYNCLGVYATLYRKRPAFYKRFINTYHFDSKGIPLYIYEGRQSYEIVQLAQYGLMEYGYYLDTCEERHRKNCLACADKLLELQDTNGGWPCDFDYPCPEVGSVLKAGWYTAMGQGQAISLFVRADVLKNKEEYRTAAHRALEVLELPVQDGGVFTKLGDLDFYEEYPTATPSYTLNGLMFCMLGLYDGAQIFKDEKAGKMFQTMLRTLRTILPFYDDETITPYDLSHITNPPRKKLRNRKYHILHVELLQAIDSIAHDEVFSFYINKWMGR